MGLLAGDARADFRYETDELPLVKQANSKWRFSQSEQHSLTSTDAIASQSRTVSNATHSDTKTALITSKAREVARFKPANKLTDGLLDWRFHSYNGETADKAIYGEYEPTQGHIALFERANASTEQPRDRVVFIDEHGRVRYLAMLSEELALNLRLADALLELASRYHRLHRPAASPKATAQQLAVALYFNNKARLDDFGLQPGTVLEFPNNDPGAVFSQARARQMMQQLRLNGFLDQQLASTHNTRPIEPRTLSTQSSNCADFAFEQGFLKPNLSRFLAQCGYSIGHWSLGDEEYEYDFEIVKDYVLRVNGIEALLHAVEQSYLVRGTRNLLDMTVDFEPSRGAVLEGMEIKEW